MYYKQQYATNQTSVCSCTFACCLICNKCDDTTSTIVDMAAPPRIDPAVVVPPRNRHERRKARALS